MASKKYSPGDVVRFIGNDSFLKGRTATVVEQPEKFDKTGYYSEAVWTDVHGERITQIHENQVELVTPGQITIDNSGGWRTVTKKEKKLLKALLNNSVEFRIQVRVKGINNG